MKHEMPICLSLAALCHWTFCWSEASGSVNSSVTVRNMQAEQHRSKLARVRSLRTESKNRGASRVSQQSAQQGWVREASHSPRAGAGESRMQWCPGAPAGMSSSACSPLPHRRDERRSLPGAGTAHGKAPLAPACPATAPELGSSRCAASDTASPCRWRLVCCPRGYFHR